MSKKKKIPARRQRMYFIIFSAICVAIATYFILNSFRNNIVFFRTPTELSVRPAKIGDAIRIGGLVKPGSVITTEDGQHEFIVTDMESELRVKYEGLLPSLFREKQGVVAYGSMDLDGSFKAEQILAKHDEKYMPPEVYKDLEKRGYLKDAYK